MKRLPILKLTLILFALSATSGFAQQNVTIGPDDDVFAILETVVDFDSTITFEAGYYQLVPPADTTGKHSLIQPPAGTTIRGAGSGMDSSNATILDCQMLFEHGIEIGDAADTVTVENLTIIHTYDDLLAIGQDVVDITFNNVWALKTHGDCVEIDGGEVQFNFCVFGWSGADTVHNDNDTVVEAVYTNCDIFLGESDLVDVDNGRIVLRNCIVYAGNGTNDVFNDNGPDGRTIVRASVGWAPFDGDPPGITEELWGRLDVESDTDILPDVDNTNIGQDPMYIKPPGQAGPGVGYLASELDLHLHPESPALTAGNTEFDAEHNPIGEPTFAGSQGVGEVGVDHWQIF